MSYRTDELERQRKTVYIIFVLVELISQHHFLSVTTLAKCLFLYHYIALIVNMVYNIPINSDGL
jgi:hypothetical protein